MTISEWDLADSVNEDAKIDEQQWLLKVCPECTGEILGHWTEGYPVARKGSICWRFHRIDGEGITVSWPKALTCVWCKKTEAREQVRKRFLSPYHLNASEATHDCGCAGIDSSD